jgi:hypothetical protein
MAVTVRVEMKVLVKMPNGRERTGFTAFEGDSRNDEMFKSTTISSLVKFLQDRIPSPSTINPYDVESEGLTIKERLAFFLQYDERAPKDWFTSSELKKIYEEAYGDDVKLSTLSTYLASLHSEDVLMRTGSRAQRKYKVAFANRVNAPDADEVIKVNDGANDDVNDEDDTELIECLPLHELLPR